MERTNGKAVIEKYIGIDGYDSMQSPDIFADDPSPRARLTRAPLPSAHEAADVVRRVQAPASRHRPAETQEWLDSFDQLVAQEGESRARFLVYKLLKRARQLHVGLPPLTQTRYINTISPEQEPFFPGDEQIEHRIRRISAGTPSRWCSGRTHRFTGIGGHLATYASAGEPVRGRLQPLLPRQGRRRAGDQVFYQGHAAPGMYARAFLEGRLTEDQLDHFRRETVPARG